MLHYIWDLHAHKISTPQRHHLMCVCLSQNSGHEKGKASSLDVAPLTILDSGALQPRKWQLTGNDCSIAAQAVAAQSPR